MSRTDVIVVGAGLAGLTAARALQVRGISTVVLDKGRSPGGRMATRTIGNARYDHGAQHFSVRSPEFRAEVDSWKKSGLVTEWFSSPSATLADHRTEPRNVGRGGMRAIPEHLAAGLFVETSIHVERIERTDDGVAAISDHGTWRATAMIVTPPAPQANDLLRRSGMRLTDSAEATFAEADYDACVSIMAELDQGAGLPQGHLTPADEAVAWIADNENKGVSNTPAITIHSTPGFAEATLDHGPSHWIPRLVVASQPHLEASVVTAAAHRWRYAQPRRTFDIGAMAATRDLPIVLAGEIYSGARVEGAFLSGAAAARLTELIA
jgi:predicted NAD/FAD-dependent oxidoreductase